MKIKTIKIDNIPTVIWGESSSKVIIAVHGNMSHKEDEVIKRLANRATIKGYQVLSFDLPEHGERKADTTCLCNPQNCISDLTKIMQYTKQNYEEINLWACSMGAYFSLLAFQNENIKRCFFLSPVVSMKVIIDNMMTWSNVTEELLKEKQEIKTEFGPTLYWDYYEYVKEHPITNWNNETYILYGEKDNMQEPKLIEDFSNRFHCTLTVVSGGEHYFHTTEQLETYEKWIEVRL